MDLTLCINPADFKQVTLSCLTTPLKNYTDGCGDQIAASKYLPCPSCFAFYNTHKLHKCVAEEGNEKKVDVALIARESAALLRSAVEKDTAEFGRELRSMIDNKVMQYGIQGGPGPSCGMGGFV